MPEFRIGEKTEMVHSGLGIFSRSRFRFWIGTAIFFSFFFLPNPFCILQLQLDALVKAKIMIYGKLS